jgi:type VI secretion system ImpB/VipA family protein
VQIAYDVEHYGSPTTIELPFVMGVMADLAGSSETREAQKTPNDRELSSRSTRAASTSSWRRFRRA